MKILFFILLLCASINSDASITNIIDKIKVRSETSQSDSLVILLNDKPLLLHQSDTSAGIDSMEMTKPFVALAIGLLLDEGRISSLETPVHYYYPRWNVEPYKATTLRHLLSNTSGLDPLYNCRIQENHLINILNAPQNFPPDTRFYRNPNAMHLLIDIVKIVSGKELGDYLYGKLFDPLGIESVFWRTGGTIDSLPQFQMSAWDLAKIGRLIANEGQWNCKQVISKRWINEILSPSQSFEPFFGMQWWLEFYDIAAWWDAELLKEFAQQGVSEPLIEKLNALQGRVIHFSGQVYGNQIVKLRGSDLNASFDEGELMAQLINETYAKGLPLARFKTGKLKMASAHGRGGQHLIIMPQEGIVAVRQRQVEPNCSFSSSPNHNFDDLPDLLEEVARAYNCNID